MKKHNTKWSLSLSKGLLLAFIILLAACKTVPTGTVVKDPDLLDKNKNFYISIPAVDTELVKYVIKSNIQGISDSDVEDIVKRIDRAYAGLNADNKDSKLQLAIDSDIPVKYIPKILTKKNGWTVKEYTGPASSAKYGVFTQEEITLAFPSDKIALIGDNVEGMLGKYDEIHNIPAEESVGINYTSLDDTT